MSNNSKFCVVRITGGQDNGVRGIYAEVQGDADIVHLDNTQGNIVEDIVVYHRAVIDAGKYAELKGKLSKLQDDEVRKYIEESIKTIQAETSSSGFSDKLDKLKKGIQLYGEIKTTLAPDLIAIGTLISSLFIR
ncbi:MAG: hypothetical protein WCB03_19585 [Rouxiella badensis]|uniref:hypothetical protein n=1 Tax=Rouxiella badensis TaxID=1646377 RepID=UPI0028D5C803|nr:hypothetical protein [Rouxiella badensis]